MTAQLRNTQSRLQRVQVSHRARIIDAMRCLDASGIDIALVIDDAGKMVGTLTDGDMRRGLLAGSTLESPLGPHALKDFVFVGPTVGRAEVLDLMKARTLEHIPVLDEEGRLVGLHLLHELLGCVERPNWVIIMAGGKGMRLRPLTEHLPKPMIPVAGRPILERLVLHAVSFGFRRIFLSINYLGHLVERHFGDGGKFGCSIDYLREPEPLGTGGGLSLLPQIPPDPLFVMNGDLVTQADFGAMLAYHQTNRYTATIGVREYTHTVPFGTLELLDGRVSRIEEKPMLSATINAGLYVLNPEILGRVPPKKEFPITKLFEESMCRGDSIGAYEIQDDWIDVGQKEQLKMARGVL